MQDDQSELQDTQQARHSYNHANVLRENRCESSTTPRTTCPVAAWCGMYAVAATLRPFRQLARRSPLSPRKSR